MTASDGVQLCEHVYFDVLGRPTPRVVPSSEAFPESPGRERRLYSWLVALVRDLLEIDAVAIYIRRTRGGTLYALELVAGEPIKPQIDQCGRVHHPPHSSYQQFLYGAPGSEYSQKTTPSSSRLASSH